MSELKRERNRFLAFAYANADVLVELDESFNICFVDGAVHTLLKAQQNELAGTNFLKLFDDESESSLRNALATSSLEGRVPTCIIRHRSVNNSYELISVSGCKLRYFDNHYFLSLNSIRNKEDSRVVPSWVTGREDFIKTAKEMIIDAGGDRAMKLTLFDLAFAINLENDKENALAKKLLADLCEYLEHHTKASGLFAHIKDFKFAILHDDKFDIDKLFNAIVQYAKNMFGMALSIPKHETTVMESLGMTEQDIARVVLYTINRFADDRGDKFTISSLYDGYKPYLDESVKQLTGFRQTLSSKKFDIALQPVVDVNTAEPHHFEALFQFDCMEPFDSASRFIDFGEKAGMIGDFDLAMCQKVLELMGDLAKKGQKPNIAVNISGKSLSSARFRDALQTVVWSHPAVRRQMILEVTDSSKIQDIQEVGRFLEEMKVRGVKSCIDDFGSGETNFDYIKFLKSDFVKLNGEYVKSALANSRNSTILKSMISVCNDLGMTTMALDVDDEKTARFLSECGISYGQGFHFGKPTTEFKKLLPQPAAAAQATTVQPPSKQPRHEVKIVPAHATKTTQVKARKFNQNQSWWKKN